MTRRSAGSSTVWALLVVLVIWAAAAVAVLEVVAVQARHRAGAAADAAALAAASEGGLDPAAACAAARTAAARLGADLVGCAMTGPDATVTVRVAPPAAISWAGRVTARSRAGPADTGKTKRSHTTRAAT